MELCAANGARYKAWLQLSDDLSTLRWGWDRRSIELERLNGVWLGVGFKPRKERRGTASGRATPNSHPGSPASRPRSPQSPQVSFSPGPKEGKEGRGRRASLMRTATQVS